MEVRSLIWQGKDLIEPVSGRLYLETHGVIDLVAEEERYSDLGDSNHYDRFPYEFVDWSDKNSIYHAIEDALKSFLEEIPQDKKYSRIILIFIILVAFKLKVQAVFMTVPVYVMAQQKLMNVVYVKAVVLLTVTVTVMVTLMLVVVAAQMDLQAVIMPVVLL